MISSSRGYRPATAEAPARPARRESYPDCSPQSSAQRAARPLADEKNPLTGPEALWLTDATVASCGEDADEWTDSGDEYRYVLTEIGGQA